MGVSPVAYLSCVPIFERAQAGRLATTNGILRLLRLFAAIIPAHGDTELGNGNRQSAIETARFGVARNGFRKTPVICRGGARAIPTPSGFPKIMLQQTQVKTVIPYWKRWMRELPTIKSVANASPDKIHKLWEGLGYYTRVRNLQKAAQQIVTRQDAISKSSRSRGLSRRSETQTDNETQIKKKLEIPSAFARLRRDKHVVSYKFPEKFDDVLALPGIGRYTAGAICSIAFNQPVPILDGNVIRVLTRIFGISQNPREKKTNARLWKLAEELVGRAVPSPPRRGGDTAPYHSFLNQSLMELGALVCAPRNPRCLICPVKKLCAAFRENRVNELPNFGKRTPVAARHFVAFIAERKGRFLVRQRPAGVVNAHLWEFPNVEIAPSQGSSGRKSAHYFRTKSQADSRRLLQMG